MIHEFMFAINGKLREVAFLDLDDQTVTVVIERNKKTPYGNDELEFDIPLPKGTLLAYTTRKDSKGAKLWQGDVGEYWHNDTLFLVLIHWGETEGQWLAKKDGIDIPLCWLVKDGKCPNLTRLGNSVTNPELLGGK